MIGCHCGDPEGEYTYIGGWGSLVIDFVIVDDKCLEFVADFQIERRVDSDQTLFRLQLESNEGRRRRKN